MTTASELKAKLESQNEEVGRIAHQIEERLEAYTDWPSQVRQHPFQSVGIAALAGLALGGANRSLMQGVGRQVGSLILAGLTASLVAAVNRAAQPSP